MTPHTLTQLRTARKLSVAELAKLTGLSRAAIYNYESGKRKPTFEALCKLATALKVSVEKFREVIAIAPSFG
jgi:transcriptional regulator with XRE-family HTH domain